MFKYSNIFQRLSNQYLSTPETQSNKLHSKLFRTRHSIIHPRRCHKRVNHRHSAKGCVKRRRRGGTTEEKDVEAYTKFIISRRYNVCQDMGCIESPGMHKARWWGGIWGEGGGKELMSAASKEILWLEAAIECNGSPT